MFGGAGLTSHNKYTSPPVEIEGGRGAPRSSASHLDVAKHQLVQLIRLVVWIPRIPLWKGLLLREIPRTTGPQTTNLPLNWLVASRYWTLSSAGLLNSKFAGFACGKQRLCGVDSACFWTAGWKVGPMNIRARRWRHSARPTSLAEINRFFAPLRIATLSKCLQPLKDGSHVVSIPNSSDLNPLI